LKKPLIEPAEQATESSLWRQPEVLDLERIPALEDGDRKYFEVGKRVIHKETMKSGSPLVS
jgi:hypothetical protein